MTMSLPPLSPHTPLPSPNCTPSIPLPRDISKTLPLSFLPTSFPTIQTPITCTHVLTLSHIPLVLTRRRYLLVLLQLYSHPFRVLPPYTTPNFPSHFLLPHTLLAVASPSPLIPASTLQAAFPRPPPFPCPRPPPFTLVPSPLPNTPHTFPLLFRCFPQTLNTPFHSLSPHTILPRLPLSFPHPPETPLSSVTLHLP